jgi:hypothetical protein
VENRRLKKICRANQIGMTKEGRRNTWCLVWGRHEFEPTNIILSDMYTLGTNGDGDVNPIIDEKWYSVGFGDGVNLIGRSNQIGSIAGLITVLYDCYTWQCKKRYID